MTADLARAALWYARHGWRVFPLKDRDKLPRIKAWQTEATTDLDRVAEWWRQWPRANIGIATGPDSGVYVIDVDTHGGDGLASLQSAMLELGPLPRTIEQRTGSGGRQLVFVYPDGLDCPNTTGKIGKAVDTRGAGGFVVVPPSIHPKTGKRYEWLIGPHQGRPSILPDRWVTLLERKPEPRITVPVPRLKISGTLGEKSLAGLCNFVSSRREGERNDGLFWAACCAAERMRAGQIGESEARTRLTSAAKAIGLSDVETARTIASAFRKVERGAA